MTLQPEWILESSSRNERIIHLSQVIWDKIRRRHPELHARAEYVEEIGVTIEDPDYVVRGWEGELLAIRWCSSGPGGGKHLCVVYRETDGEGFVITAFFVGRYEQLLRRGILWQKS